MEQLLIWLIVLVAFLAIAYAVIQWSGIPISPFVMRVATILIVAIVVVVLIRFLWPVLIDGQLPALR